MTYLQRFEGRPILVTGAAVGLGRAVALRLAGEGAPIALADIQPDALEATADEVRALGVPAIAMKTDVTDPTAVREMVDAASEELGPLWGAVNNAGRATPQILLGDTEEDDWDAVMDLNLRGVFLCCKYELRHMAEAGSGSIVNVSSLVGLRAPGAGIGPYITSKHGVIGVTKSAARDYAAQGIRVNAVCPGHMRTPMLHDFFTANPAAEKAATRFNPMGRIGEPEEVAAAISFLLSDDASYVTGQSLAIDGGDTL